MDDNAPASQTPESPDPPAELGTVAAESELTATSEHAPASAATATSERTGWLCFAAVGVLAFYVLGAWVGSYALCDPWEGRYGLATIEMMERGDLITPYEIGEIRWAKPIFIYWCMAACAAVFGQCELAARLPSVLAGVLGALSLFYTLWRLRGIRAGLIAACVLISIPQYGMMARQAVPDMLMCGFLAAALGCLALARFQEQRRLLHLVIFYLAVGLAVLTKGPVAGAIVVSGMLLFWLPDFNPRWLRPRLACRWAFEQIRFYRMGLGLLIFLVVAMPWYIAMLVLHGRAFIDNFIVYENLRRFSEPILDLTGRAVHYVETMMHGMYPWAGFVPPALFFLGGSDREPEQQRLRWFFASSFLATFILFTMSASKVDHYILPAAAPLAALVALIWEYYFREDGGWTGAAFIIAASITMFAFRDFTTYGDSLIFDVYTTRRGIIGVDMAKAIHIAACAWLAIALLGVLVRGSRIVAGLTLAAAIGWNCFILHYVLPKQAPVRSMKPFLTYYNQYHSDDSVMIVCGKVRQTMSYYLGSYYNYYHEDPEDVPPIVRKHQDAFIVCQSRYVNAMLVECQKVTGTRWGVVPSPHASYYLLINTARIKQGQKLQIE